MLLLLNEKLKQNPNFPIPHGYKKVTDVIIEDSYHVPDQLGMSESEKISMELLDEVLLKAAGLHILESIPVKRTVTRVVPDQNTLLLDYATNANIRAQSQGSSVFAENDANSRRKKNKVRGKIALHAGIKSAISRQSVNSNNSRSYPQSPNMNRNKNYMSTPQILAAKGKLLESSFTRNNPTISNAQNLMGPPLRPELKLAVMQAKSPEEKTNVAQCATILEEMLLAVENGDKIEDFSLVENQKKYDEQL